MNFIKFRAHASMCASVESNKIDGVPNSPQQTTQVMKLGGNVGFTLEYQNLGQKMGSLITAILKRFITFIQAKFYYLKVALGELLHYLVH